jgi:hypothetical protein
VTGYNHGLSIAEMEAAMEPYGVPQHLRNGLARYILHGIRPGGFLDALLVNDLRLSVHRADAESLRAIPQVLEFLHWNAPSACYGTPQRHDAWMERGGLLRMVEGCP